MDGVAACSSKITLMPHFAPECIEERSLQKFEETESLANCPPFVSKVSDVSDALGMA